VLPARSEKRIAAAGGRPTNSDLPYFNLEWGQSGLIVVIGWPGQWSARFVRDEGKVLRVLGGQELTHLKLHPGEEIRTPLVVLQFWEGDRVRSQNIWRRWMRAHNLPRPGGKPLKAQTAACSSHQFGEMIRANEENQKFFIDRYLEEGIALDYWWMDAGWYPVDTNTTSGAGRTPAHGRWTGSDFPTVYGRSAITAGRRVSGPSSGSSRSG
jgi:alpha-galactosidase